MLYLPLKDLRGVKRLAYSQLLVLDVIKFIPLTSHLINTSLPPFVGNEMIMMRTDLMVTSVFKKRM